MHRMGVYLGLVEDDDYAESGDYSGAHEPERMPARREEYPERYARAARPSEPVERAYGDDSYRSESYRDGDYAYAEQRGADVGAQPTYQITALHPRTYNEARTIGEAFRRATPVIMNLSEMEDADAKRLVDFAAGLTFGLHGRIERVTAKVFLLSPHNVEVTAQDKARIESGFFNQS
jgi:cell division inhibitor SepF